MKFWKKWEVKLYNLSGLEFKLKLRKKEKEKRKEIERRKIRRKIRIKIRRTKGNKQKKLN